MYAHAQLDFESRLMKASADEKGSLVDRLNQGDVSNIISQHSQLDDDAGSIQTTRLSATISNPRDPHKNITSGTDRHRRDVSSFDIEVARGRGMARTNPYVYHIGVTGYFKRLIELWRNKRCQRALLSASIAMISQQLTGVNMIAPLGTEFWSKSLESTTPPQTIAIIGLIFGAVTYLGGLPSYWLSDRYGRSIMLALGLPNMAWSMFVFAFLFKIPEQSAGRTPLAIVFSSIFTLFYASTAGTSPSSISAEVFPLVSREVGMAVSVAVNLTGAGILVLVLPQLLHSIGTTALLLVFAALNVVAFVLVFLFVPETRRRTLEELQYTFDLSTRLHVEYRTGYIRRCFFENVWRFVRGEKVKSPTPFYRWARVTQQTGARSGARI